jgi:hypothetical protein
VFVVAYVGGQDRPLSPRHGPGMRAIALLFSGALLVEIAIAIIGSGLKALDSRGPHVPPGFGSPSAIGQLLLERFLIAFEVASFLLLIAAVGAVVLAGRRRGLEDPETLPERAGSSPMPRGEGGPSVPGEDEATRLPSGGAEGLNDPAVEEPAVT